MQARYVESVFSFWINDTPSFTENANHACRASYVQATLLLENRQKIRASEIYKTD
jgi:hypothetical protein